MDHHDHPDKPVSEPTIRCLLDPYPIKYRYASGLRSQPVTGTAAVGFGASRVSIIDPKTDMVIASAAAAQVTATPAMFEKDISSDRDDTRTTMPVVIVSVPGSRPLSIGCLESCDTAGVGSDDLRFWWRGTVPWVRPPAYVAWNADWRALVKNVGLAPYLHDSADAQPGWGDREWITSQQDVTAAAKTGRDRRSTHLWAFTPLGVGLAMFLLFFSARSLYEYHTGIPTTATVTDCATHSTCVGTWSIGGVAESGALPQKAAIGSTLEVRVSNGKLYSKSQWLKSALFGGGVLVATIALFVADRSRRGTVVRRSI